MAGAVVVDKVVRITITSKQGENAIDRILHLIEEAESRKAPLNVSFSISSVVGTQLLLMMVVACLSSSRHHLLNRGKNMGCTVV
ncbi:hypothetical protein OK016_15445 [Vibrio chagasii]|nr:hypothetical protein [Vibrio chagasii]